VTLSLALAALALSLAGAAHCAAMCGGFVAAMHFGRSSRVTAPHAAALHAGRITSYALIGAALGAAGSVPFELAHSQAAHRVLFLLACAVLAASGLRLAGVDLTLPAAPHSRWARAVGARATALGRRIGAPRTPLHAALLGALWGWAPCALVYAALPLALVSGSSLSGAVVMAAFGLGTLPALAGAGWLLSRFGRPAARAWVGGAIVLMALVAAARALVPESMLPALLCAG
jgi:sulfite exporter TauE/SafE